MTKAEFLSLLEQRLIVLNDEERTDLLSEYAQHIDMKVASGLSEAEAIADFGDPEELIKALLEAYHLNTNYQPTANDTLTESSHTAQPFVIGVRKRFSTFCHTVSNRVNKAVFSIKQKAAKQKEQRAIKQSNKPAKAENAPRKQIDITAPLLSVGSVCKKLLVWCCKCIGLFCLVGIGISTLALLAGSAALLVFVVTGYQIIGPFLVVLGCTLLSLVVTGMLMQFVFGIGGASA